jgi:hypothetical protein
MTGKTYILLFFSCAIGFSALAQSTNRQKMLSVILTEPKFRIANNSNDRKEPLTNTFNGSSVLFTPTLSAIPRYCLPKGNVFCRLEDYVQMHTPMKLNIGVGGQ